MRRFVSKLAYKLNDFIAYKNALGIKYDTNLISIISNMETMIYLQRGWLKAGLFGTPENRNPRTGAGYHPSGNLAVICAVSEKVMPTS